MLALYRSLLRLYPAAYFREYGGEMILVLAQAHADMRKQTRGARVSFCFREVTGLVVGAVRQRFCGPGDWNGMRRFDMRPEFRFPRSTVVLMWVILAGVVLTIDQAKTIVRVKEGLPPGITAAWGSLWLLFAPLLVLAAAAAGWGILFALRRTGMHRLEKMQTGPEQP
jgi:hypothetical protein